MSVHCKKHNLEFPNRSELMKHQRKEGEINKNKTKRISLSNKEKQVEYSFFNSPKELTLDLGDYVISVKKK